MRCDQRCRLPVAIAGLAVLLPLAALACGGGSPPLPPQTPSSAAAPEPERAPVPLRPGRWQQVDGKGYVLQHDEPAGGGLAELAGAVASAAAAVQAFFGAPFSVPVTVWVYPDRERLTAQWRVSMPKLEPQCWMVGRGSAEAVDILSPRVWATQACDHHPAPAHVTALIAHELVHAFHEQRLPRQSFEGLEDIEWFAEGLATYASGQLDLGYLASPAEAVARGQAPADLRSAHRGKYRYGVCGSLVRFLDRRVGRAALTAALRLESTAELLAELGQSEEELLSSWKAEAGTSPP